MKASDIAHKKCIKFLSNLLNDWNVVLQICKFTHIVNLKKNSLLDLLQIAENEWERERERERERDRESVW